LTQRAKAWLAQRVGVDLETVAAMSQALGLGWRAVMRAVFEIGQPLVDGPHRLAGMTGLGVDEHAWQRANPVRHTRSATGIVDITPGRPARLLDVRNSQDLWIGVSRDLLIATL
jgi:hypothetical protein